MEMDFIGAGKRIEDLDIPRIGARIGVGEDEIHAVMDVEAAGSGFDAKGRPKMLFEPHIFYKLLGPGVQRDKAITGELAYSTWRSGSYPSDSYPRLAKAMEINRVAALRSASWGLPQIMGFNSSLAGYDNIEVMLDDFKNDEETHLNAMVTFIISAGLDDELKRHDWSGFARGYNGSSYAKHGYHTKLERAFNVWSKRKDTLYLPGVEMEPVPESRSYMDQIGAIVDSYRGNKI